MTTSEGPPQGKNEVSFRRMGCLEPGIWAGILAVLLLLPATYLTANLVREALYYWERSSFPKSTDAIALILQCLTPFIVLDAFVALIGIVSARKRGSAFGLGISVAALILTAVLLLATLFAERRLLP